MAKKEVPSWKLNDLPEPPIVNGYWDYGTVWSIYMHRPRFHYWRQLGHQTYWALWSYYYWGKKVRKALRYVATDCWGLLRGRPWPSSPAKVTKGPAVEKTGV